MVIWHDLRLCISKQKLMKHLLYLFTFLISSVSIAQDSTQVVIAEAPRIVSKLLYGEKTQFNNIELEFVEVLQDSRCPKNVTCVWAGEVIVLVDVFENGVKSEQKKLTLSPTSHLQDRLGNLFFSEEIKISGFNVLPYPVSGIKTNKEDYYIQIDITN
jgi:hypothetical protein